MAGDRIEQLLEILVLQNEMVRRADTYNSEVVEQYPDRTGPRLQRFLERKVDELLLKSDTIPAPLLPLKRPTLKFVFRDVDGVLCNFEHVDETTPEYRFLVDELYTSHLDVLEASLRHANAHGCATVTVLATIFKDHTTNDWWRVRSARVDVSDRGGGGLA